MRIVVTSQRRRVRATQPESCWQSSNGKALQNRLGLPPNIVIELTGASAYCGPVSIFPGQHIPNRLRYYGAPVSPTLRRSAYFSLASH
jgi:hypothetical protein